MTTLVMSTGGCASYPCYSFKLKRALVPFFSWLLTENPSREVATEDHSSNEFELPERETPQT